MYFTACKKQNKLLATEANSPVRQHLPLRHRVAHAGHVDPAYPQGVGLGDDPLAVDRVCASLNMLSERD